MAPTSPVAAVLEHAGATMVARAGRTLPLHFGSSAGELAACSVAVGLAERGDLGIHAISGSVEAVEHATVLLAGTLIAPGGAVVQGDVAWCATSARRLLVVAEGSARATVADAVARVADRHPGLTARALGDTLAGCELLGPRTEETLAALGVPRTLTPAVQTLQIDGVAATVVHRSWVRALILTDPVWAIATWTAVDRAGAPSGVTCVGADAVARFRFVEPLLT